MALLCLCWEEEAKGILLQHIASQHAGSVGDRPHQLFCFVSTISSTSSSIGRCPTQHQAAAQQPASLGRWCMVVRREEEGEIHSGAAALRICLSSHRKHTLSFILAAPLGQAPLTWAVVAAPAPTVGVEAVTMGKMRPLAHRRRRLLLGGSQLRHRRTRARWAS